MKNWDLEHLGSLQCWAAKVSVKLFFFLIWCTLSASVLCMGRRSFPWFFSALNFYASKQHSRHAVLLESTAQWGKEESCSCEGLSHVLGALTRHLVWSLKAPYEQVLSTCAFHRWRNWSPEKLSGLSHVMGLNVFIPHNSYVGALTPNGMVFEHGAFGRLGLDEIISVG